MQLKHYSTACRLATGSHASFLLTATRSRGEEDETHKKTKEMQILKQGKKN